MRLLLQVGVDARLAASPGAAGLELAADVAVVIDPPAQRWSEGVDQLLRLAPVRVLDQVGGDRRERVGELLGLAQLAPPVHGQLTGGRRPPALDGAVRAGVQPHGEPAHAVQVVAVALIEEGLGLDVGVPPGVVFERQHPVLGELAVEGGEQVALLGPAGVLVEQVVLVADVAGLPCGDRRVLAGWRRRA